MAANHLSNRVMDIRYDESTDRFFYDCASVIFIEDFCPNKYHHHKILDLAIESSRGRQNSNFVLQNRDDTNRLTYEDLASLKPSCQFDLSSPLKYQQVHSARSDPEFHKYISKLPKSGKPKAKGRHLSAEQRIEYYKLFGYALAPGLDLPVQDLNMTYTEATGKDIDPNSGTIPRPMNNFLTFSHCLRGKVNMLLKDEGEKQAMLSQGINYLKLLENSNCKTLQNSTLSKALSEFWNFQLLPSEKQFWDDESKVLLKLHKRQFPDYKYKPQRPQKKPEEEKAKIPSMKRSLSSSIPVQSKKMKIANGNVLNKTDTLTSSPVGQFVNHSPEPVSPSSCGSSSPLGRGLETNLESVQMTFKPPSSSTILEVTDIAVVAPISPAPSSASTTFSQQSLQNTPPLPLSPMLSSVATTSNFSEPLVSHVMQNPSSAGSFSYIEELAETSYGIELFSDIPLLESHHNGVEDVFGISNSDLLPLQESIHSYM